MPDLHSVKVFLAAVLHVLIVAAGVWDLVALAAGRPDATISSVTHGWARDNPVLPLVVGIVIGHLFWPVN